MIPLLITTKRIKFTTQIKIRFFHKQVFFFCFSTTVSDAKTGQVVATVEKIVTKNENGEQKDAQVVVPAAGINEVRNEWQIRINNNE